jgi:hypothetical protein
MRYEVGALGQKGSIILRFRLGHSPLSMISRKVSRRCSNQLIGRRRGGSIVVSLDWLADIGRLAHLRIAASQRGRPMARLPTPAKRHKSTHGGLDRPGRGCYYTRVGLRDGERIGVLVHHGEFRPGRSRGWCPPNGGVPERDKGLIQGARIDDISPRRRGCLGQKPLDFCSLPVNVHAAARP